MRIRLFAAAMVFGAALAGTSAFAQATAPSATQAVKDKAAAATSTDPDTKAARKKARREKAKADEAATQATSKAAAAPAAAAGAAKSAAGSATTAATGAASTAAATAKTAAAPATAATGAVKAKVGGATPNATPAQIAAAKASGMVWVNTGSGVWHTEGEYYGATKEGKFMTVADATKAGYRAAKEPVKAAAKK